MGRLPHRSEHGVAWWHLEQWMESLTLHQHIVLILRHKAHQMLGGRWTWGTSTSSTASQLSMAGTVEVNYFNVDNVIKTT